MSNTNRPELRGRMPRTDTARPAFKVIGYGDTDVGRRREANEDSFLMIPRNNLWIVADGMGGHAGGQEASRLTVQTVGDTLIRLLRQAEVEAQAGSPESALNISQLITAAIRRACSSVFDTARIQPELHGMGSTITMMLVYGGNAYFGHVGDSRAYLIRAGEIHQLTEDHSLVQEQVAAGLITPEQARHSPVRNIITRSIGFEREVKVDVGALPIMKGDRYVLCSDGLTGNVEDREIMETVAAGAIGSAPRRLINLANERGGEDNSTVIVLDVVSARGRPRRKRKSP